MWLPLVACERDTSQAAAGAPLEIGVDRAVSDAVNRDSLRKAFQLLLQWRGRMGIRGHRMMVDRAPEPDATGEAGDDEDGPNIVTERGESPE